MMTIRDRELLDSLTICVYFKIEYLPNVNRYRFQYTTGTSIIDIPITNNAAEFILEFERVRGYDCRGELIESLKGYLAL